MGRLDRAIFAQTKCGFQSPFFWSPSAVHRFASFPISPEKVTARDMMGNPAELMPHGDGFKIDINGEPLYLIVDIERGADLRSVLEQAEPLR